MSNPPYFAAGSGPAGTQAAARQAARGGEEGLCAAAFRALKTGGRFCLSLPPARLASYIAALRRARLEPKRLLPVCPRAGTAPTLLLLESRREGGEGLRFLPPLILQTRTGAPTAALRRIYDPQARKRGPERSEP